jgi:hypothetical protein
MRKNLTIVSGNSAAILDRISGFTRFKTLLLKE